MTVSKIVSRNGLLTSALKGNRTRLLRSSLISIACAARPPVASPGATPRRSCRDTKHRPGLISAGAREGHGTYHGLWTKDHGLPHFLHALLPVNPWLPADHRPHTCAVSAAAIAARA